MRFFYKLKKIFSRKKEENASVPEVHAAAPVQIEEEHIEENAPKPRQEKIIGDEQVQERRRNEKKCIYCGAPNDSFVTRCWLCKKNI